MYTDHPHFASFRKLAEDLAHGAPADNMKEVEREYEHNNADNRAYLRHTFTHAQGVEDNLSKTVKKLFPGRDEKVDKTSGHPLLKLAQHTYRFALRETPLLKQASTSYQAAAFLSFQRELDKIAALMNKPMGVPGKTLGMGRGRPALPGPKTYHISDTGTQLAVTGQPQLAPGVQAMREAAARKSPGLLQRVGDWLGR